MPRTAARKEDKSSTTSATSKKAHAMPVPPLKKMMMMPPPARFGSNGRSSQSVSFNNIIYLAGQHAEDLSQDVRGQTEQVCKVIDKLLAESMSDKTKIIRADIFIKDKSALKQVNEVWEKWIGEPKYAPPCTCAIVPDFVKDGVLVEIIVIAVISKDYDEEAEAEDEKAAE